MKKDLFYICCNNLNVYLYALECALTVPNKYLHENAVRYIWEMFKGQLYPSLGKQMNPE